MDEPFGVDPAQRVRADAKLARVVGNNHGVRQQALMMDRAPERRFAGDEHGIGSDLHRAQAQRLQMTSPSRPRDEKMRALCCLNLPMTICGRLRSSI